MVVTTTDSQGRETTTAPSIITSTLIFTSSGLVVTSTQIGLNPTLSTQGSGQGDNSFFKNTGAVAGVFVLVGLAAASIVLFLIFYVRRRHRAQLLVHDHAAAVRTPLDDEEFNPRPEMNNRASGSIPTSIPTSAGRTSTFFDHEGGDFNPYAEYGHPMPGSPSNPTAYVPARTYSPPLGSTAAMYSPHSPQPSDNGTKGHSASPSYEPLLASFYQAQTAEETQDKPPTPPPRDPRRSTNATSNPPPVIVRDDASSVYSRSSSSADDRLDPATILKTTRGGANGDIDVVSVRDEEDYSRKILGVRNVPDGASLGSRD